MARNATAAARTAPVHPRRISGPVRRPLPAGPPVRSRTGTFERISRLPDHFVVDRLLRSRACIWLIGIMLGGIVAMQVSLLRLNAGISRAVQTQSTLELQNATMQASIAEATSSEKLRAAAADAGMVEPQAGDTRYLRARPTTDPRRAARRMKPPSEQAGLIMSNGGRLPGALATPEATATTAVAPIPTPVPTPVAAPTAVPTVTPAPPAPTATAVALGG
jgi:hypothetical protein